MLGTTSIYECQNPVLLSHINLGYGKKYVNGRHLTHSVSKCKCGDKVVRVARPLVKDVERYEKYTDAIPLYVRCGKCDHCRKLSMDNWFTRLVHQRVSNPECMAFFATMTFSDNFFKSVSHLKNLYPDDIPLDNGLNDRMDYRELYRFVFQPFKKRLRATYGLKFDYFLCSELGEDKGRFHYHVIFLIKNPHDYDSEAYRFARVFPYKHWVKAKKRNSNIKPRIQSDLEFYLQSVLEHEWSLERYGTLYEDATYNPENKSFSGSSNPIGWITAFEPQSVGMFKYICNYTNKCAKDGLTTYTRQTKGLGFDWAEQHIKDILDGASCVVGKKSDGSDYKLPIPRAYVKKFGDHDKSVAYILRNTDKVFQKYFENKKDSDIFVLAESFKCVYTQQDIRRCLGMLQDYIKPTCVYQLNLDYVLGES